MYNYKATVLRVVDGDTFDALVNLGFNITKKQRFRLKDVDTPEEHQTGDRGGKRAW